MKSIVLLFTVAGFGVANATLHPIGPFDGPWDEGFENIQSATAHGGPYSNFRTLDDNAIFVCFEDEHPDLFPGPTFELQTVTTGPRTGNQLLGVTSRTTLTGIIFDTPVLRFGAFWKFADTANLRLRFFTESGVETDIQISGLESEWQWFGWEDAAGIKNFDFVGNKVAIDDMTATPVPEPASLVALGMALAALRRKKSNT